jgi:hypothetical protein
LHTEELPDDGNQLRPRAAVGLCANARTGLGGAWYKHPAGCRLAALFGRAVLREPKVDGIDAREPPMFDRKQTCSLRAGLTRKAGL